jgi:hypothetical protein
MGMPVIAPAPCSKILRAHTFNPEFTPRIPTAQEAYIEEELEEEIPAGMITKDTTPVVFVVPEGCDSMDLLFGPIEVNPSCGCDSALDQIVTVGEAKLSANVCDLDAPLAAGDQIRPVACGFVGESAADQYALIQKLEPRDNIMDGHTLWFRMVTRRKGHAHGGT